MRRSLFSEYGSIWPIGWICHGVLDLTSSMSIFSVYFWFFLILVVISMWSVVLVKFNLWNQTGYIGYYAQAYCWLRRYPVVFFNSDPDSDMIFDCSWCQQDRNGALGLFGIWTEFGIDKYGQFMVLKQFRLVSSNQLRRISLDRESDCLAVSPLEVQFEGMADKGSSGRVEETQVFI